MTSIADRLADLLESERQALLAGDFDRIATLLEEKQSLAKALGDDPVSVESLQPLQGALRRNQALFDRALEGVRAVVSRLGSVQALGRSFDSYDAKGRRFSIDNPATNQLEKRA
ncbi:hypothetical protein [Thetidibacter halocola]|uniref:Flagellar protein FlgN n=1 Tax=Thetidibacter halocola TaxID=2827239 RepID=A0A8J7WE28_9RHOB|nr:hypothetical protein [Thetidibacter halocola]MBS0123668.1 hypothetical protein [Thetidibacter halocola]